MLHRAFRRAGTAATIIVVSAVGLTAMPTLGATPQTVTRSGWAITPTPNPRAANGLLNSVSCPAPDACTAVGLHVRTSGLGVTLAERWNGSNWVVQSTPNPSGAQTAALNGVSCASASACMGVGQWAGGSGVQVTLAESWDGRTWRVRSTPNPTGSSASSLLAVACVKPSSCMAVGSSDGGVLVERWNGTGWRTVPAPDPTGAQFSELNGIACTHASCTAVGDYVDGSGIDRTLAERWNGVAWHIQSTPSPGTSFNFLTGVSCKTASSCMAVGGADGGLLAERWNGTAWKVQNVPGPTGSQFGFFFAVSCARSGSCEAVGGYSNSSGAFVTLGARWNRIRWQVQRTPDPARASANYLGGVACTSSSDCIAVGQGNGEGTPVTLAERWDGDAWGLQPIPSPIGAAENQLNGIACSSSSDCEAVGTAGPTLGVSSTEALHWTGRRWHLQPIPTVPGANLLAVSCVSPSSCTAVGGSNRGTLAERWNGTRWYIQRTPTPTGARFPGLGAVSCVSSSNCMAVGSYSDGTGDQFVLSEGWNGTTWRIIPAPNPSSEPQSSFNGVACTSPTACIAVGTSFDANGDITGTFAERWDGASWSLLHTPTQHTPGGYLASVWCGSAAACLATGSTDAGTLAERWDGSSWTVLPIPNPPGTQGDFMSSVSCASMSACTGVGLAFLDSGFPPETLAERWNGSAWHVQSTPALPVVHDISGFSVACPEASMCAAVGGFENDGPGAKTLGELWNRQQEDRTAPAIAVHGAMRSSFLGCLHGELSDPWLLGRNLGPDLPGTELSGQSSIMTTISSLCA